MRRTLGTTLVALTLLAVPHLGLAQTGAGPALPGDELDRVVRLVYTRDFVARSQALTTLEARGDTDVVAALIQALRFFGLDPQLVDTLQKLTGQSIGADWHAWMLWQEENPQITPYSGFTALKADMFALIDPNFRLFLGGDVEHEIRIEEITWGGVVKDGIPALINATQISPAAADYLTDGELVFGVEINGDARAYPLRVMDWHEMFNDVIGGVPVALAYCTLCGSGILFETLLPDRGAPLVFGSSGFLYRSNKLMYDHETNSLWNQFTGRPVVGALTGSGTELKVRPVTITSWAAWLDKHPDTTVLSLDTGYPRDYTPGRPYGDYFASAELMFPAQLISDSLAAKDYVFALRLADGEKAWRLTDFEGGRVVNDTFGDLDVVLIGDAATRTVRAYAACGRDFAGVGGDVDRVVADGMDWRVEEAALVAANGERLERLAGHVAYWFAYSNFKEGSPLADAVGG